MYNYKKTRLAVLADIHSNYHAFKACVDWIDNNFIDGIIFLGDYVSDCANPQKTMELLYMLQGKYNIWFVGGNREDAMIEGNINASMGSLVYTYENLTKKDIDFFKTLPLSIEIKLEGAPVISASHGDFHNNRENIYPDNDVCKRLFAEMPGSLHLCGHSHHAFVHEQYGKVIVNPGSVGVPHDKTAKAGMAVIELEDEFWKPELLQIEYDVEKAVEEIGKSELYLRDNAFARMVIATVRTGHDYKTAANKLYAKYVKLGCQNEKLLWNKVMDELGI